MQNITYQSQVPISETKAINVQSNSVPQSNYWHEPKRTLGNVAFQEKVSLKIFSNSIEVYNPNRCAIGAFVPERQKNDIGKFSKHSRLRMMKVLSKLHLNSYSQIFHVTLTYRDSYPANLSRVKEQFNLFTKLLRARNLEFSFVSRIEFQRRGAPHFHVIFLFKKFLKFINDEERRLYFTRFWLHAISQDSIAQQLHAVKVTSTNHPKQFFYYVSKYSAKEDERLTSEYKGRRWSCSKNLELSPVEEYQISNSNALAFCHKLKCYLQSKNRLSEELKHAIERAPRFHILIGSEELDQILSFNCSGSS